MPRGSSSWKIFHTYCSTVLNEEIFSEGIQTRNMYDNLPET